MPKDETILIHVCCGPCAIKPCQHLASCGYKVLGYFYNPNIHPLYEYLERRNGAQNCFARLDMALEYNDSWDLKKWLAMQDSHLDPPERCENCISQRLTKTAAQAKEWGLDSFTTSLLYSKYQPHEYIRQQGEQIGKETGVKFIYWDFREYWQEGIDISKDWGLYRQKYCGCIFSEAERYAKKLKNLQK